tara:strand:+ start:21 stop:878 length:858 start_codon:yes stop_codon:yes gene_type:complete
MRCDEIRLGLRSLYIVPSRFGLLWLAGAAFLLLVAIQTASNSTLLLGFLMLGVMLLAMFLTHDTLYGLTVRCGQPAPAFAAETITYPLILQTRSPRPPMRLRFRDGSEAADLQLSAGITTLALPWTPQCRGWQQPPQLQIETIAPLGLFICWTRWLPPQAQLIWPRRRSGPVGERSATQSRDGLDEWHDLRDVRDQERPAVVDWTGAARGRPLQAKVFTDPSSQEWMLEPASGLPLDRAVEHLAQRVMQLHQQGVRYGLHLRGKTLAPDQGLRHRNACLEALATA